MSLFHRTLDAKFDYGARAGRPNISWHVSVVLLLSTVYLSEPVGLTARAFAQQVVGIVAVVNDEAISAYDLEQRLNLIIRSSNLADSQEARQRLAPRVLNSLVEEALQLQEAKRLGITVPEKDLDAALGVIERQNNLPPGRLPDFLKSRGIDRRTLDHQVRANLAWSQVVRRLFARTINVTDAEVEVALERIKENADKPRLLLAEIFIAVDSPSEEPAARSNAMRIFEEIKRGASFPLLAFQFSESSSAQNGGDLGWVQPGELEPEVGNILLNMPARTVTEPIRTASGYYIMLIRDRRQAPAAQTGKTLLSLRQIVIPLPSGTAAADEASQHELAKTIRATVRGCEDFTSVAKELSSDVLGDLGIIKLDELPEDLRSTVGNLEVGMPSRPVQTPEGLRLLMVCNREEPKANIPSHEQVRRNLVVQRLEMRARRHLRDLRESAFLDIRT